MSPEQAGGDRTLDARTDVYALGAVLYEMLAGEPPFTGPTAQAILARVMTEEPRPLSLRRKAVPPHVEAAVARALEKLPADRFQTAAEFGAALTGAGASSQRRTRRLPAVQGGPAVPWALSVVLLLALAWVGLRSGRTAPPSTGSVRFSVELDPGVQPTFTPIVRLSADGRQLFVTANIDRREEVLHRPFDQAYMRVIAGAGQGDQGTGNSRPFVSPNGRWIAYAAQGKLRKVPVEGGPAIDLAAAEWAGGSWGRNGRLVYTRAYNTGLWIVSEGGGDARLLTLRTRPGASWATGGRRSFPMATTCCSPPTEPRSIAPPSRSSRSNPGLAPCWSPGASSAPTCPPATSSMRWAKPSEPSRST